MSNEKIKVYGYRWVVLLLFMLLNITVQILWITFAAVTIPAQTYFGGVDELYIFLLSAIFMIIYIPDTFLASWLIERYEFKVGCGIGAITTAIFGFLRFFAGSDYLMMLIFTIGIAIGQPFVMNSITKLSGNWFPKTERTMATGLGTLSMFVGILLGVLLTPFLIVGNDLSLMLLIYGIVSLIIGILFIIFTKSRPLTPPSSDTISEKVLMFEGLKKLFRNKSFLILVFLFFIGLGIFNMITTYIQVILTPKNPLVYDETFAGIVGGIMLFGGIFGAIILSALSDKFQKKVVLIIIISLIIAATSLFVFTFITDEILLMITAFLFGFGLLGAAPVALEYAVDITKPVPEASSNGILMMVGQIGGIFFILGLADFKLPNGDYLPALLLEAILITVSLIFSFFLKGVKQKF